MVNWLKREVTDLIKGIKEMNNLLKSDKIESFIVLWIIFFLGVFFLILFFNTQLNLNLVGDAMGGIFGTLISTLVFIFVVHSYQLQKKELIETRKALEGQERAMKEQKIQTMIISMLELAQNHLNSFRDTLIKGYFSTPAGRDVVSLYTQNTPNIEQDTKDGVLNNAIYYFRTLKYIESMIVKEFNEDKGLLNDNIGLLESQITENLRNLHGLLLNSKIGNDKEMITFEYIFSNQEIDPKSLKQDNGPKLFII